MDSGKGHELSTPEECKIWTATYVVYGYTYVPDGETLNIDAGARVHFHANYWPDKMHN
jgi:hypothetical protein